MRQVLSTAVLSLLLFKSSVFSFSPLTSSCNRGDLSLQVSTSEVEESSYARAASKFKVVTCMSSSCCKKRETMGLDSLATFTAFYGRAQEGADMVEVEEVPCLGGCQKGPVVAIEHSEFDGTVAIEGMTEREFNERVFHNVVTEDDADRVWSSVTNAIEMMALEEE